MLLVYQGVRQLYFAISREYAVSILVEGIKPCRGQGNPHSSIPLIHLDTRRVYRENSAIKTGCLRVLARSTFPIDHKHLIFMVNRGKIVSVSIRFKEIRACKISVFFADYDLSTGTKTAICTSYSSDEPCLIDTITERSKYGPTLINSNGGIRYQII